MCVPYLVNVLKNRKKNIFYRNRFFRPLYSRDSCIVLLFQISPLLKLPLTTDQVVFSSQSVMSAMALLCPFLGSLYYYHLYHLLLTTFEHFWTCGGLL